MKAFVATLYIHLMPAVPREEHNFPMAAVFSQGPLPESVLNCKLSTTNTPVAGGMHLSPKQGIWDACNGVYHTDLTLLFSYPLFSVLQIIFLKCNWIYLSLIINSSMTYCIKVKAQILIWPSKTWIHATLPRFPVLSISESLHFRQRVLCILFLFSEMLCSFLPQW